MAARSLSMEYALSIIIPVYNDASAITELFSNTRFEPHVELIGVDGGSNDNSFEILKTHCHIAIQSETGRAIQMNAGAKKASARQLLFLHADSRLPRSYLTDIQYALTEHDWGRFNLRFELPAFKYKVLAKLINVRSKLTQVATGDQCLFFKRSFFNNINAFPNIPLMEDVAISKIARQEGRYAALSSQATTSARRWEQHGFVHTIFLMWQLRLAYFLGTAPETLHKWYYR